MFPAAQIVDERPSDVARRGARRQGTDQRAVTVPLATNGPDHQPGQQIDYGDDSHDSIEFRIVMMPRVRILAGLKNAPNRENPPVKNGPASGHNSITALRYSAVEAAAVVYVS